MANLTGNPNYELQPGTDPYKKPDLFTLWYNKYVRGGPTPAPSYSPPSTVPGVESTFPAKPQAPPPTVPAAQAPGATPGTTPTAPAAETGWTDRLTQGMQDPAKVGLLATGLSMLATPPRQVPYSAGEIIGKAGLQGLSVFQQALAQKKSAAAAEAEALYRGAAAKHYEAETEKTRAETEKLRSGGSIITKALAQAIGRPEMEGQDIEAVTKLSSFAKTEKTKDPDYKEIMFQGKKVTVNVNDPSIQKALDENKGEWEFTREPKEGTPGATLSIETRDDGTYIVDKVAKTATKVPGIPGGKAKGEKDSVLQEKLSFAEKLAQEQGWTPDMKGYNNAVGWHYKETFGRAEDILGALTGGSLAKAGLGGGPPKPPTSGGEGIPKDWKHTGETKTNAKGQVFKKYTSSDGKQTKWFVE